MSGLTRPCRGDQAICFKMLTALSSSPRVPCITSVAIKAAAKTALALAIVQSPAQFIDARANLLMCGVGEWS